MKFDFVIGNPPYQEDTIGDNDGFAPPVYDKFLDAAFEVADKVELIHPARFLFNAGSTKKSWNEKMLHDEHFKILEYHANASEVFANTSINGGVAISYRDSQKSFGEIGIFTEHNSLNSILNKVISHAGFDSIEKIVFTRTSYKLTDKMHEDHPEAKSQLSEGHAYDFASNIFDRVPQIFYQTAPDDGHQYYKALGRKDNARAYYYIRKDYVNTTANTRKFKVVLAKADGAAGQIGKPIPARITGESIVLGPDVITTESFITIGVFDSQSEAENARKYVRTRFARTMLGVLKVTQELGPQKWAYVPIQNFTSNSDVDWSKSYSEIDQQLYAKYSLSPDEISFIEAYVKEME